MKTTRSGRRTFLTAAGTALAFPMISRGYAAGLRPIKLAWIRQFAPAAVVQKGVELAGKAGLEVELVGFNRGLDGMVAIQKGDVIGANCLVGYSQFCLALSEGIDLTCISGSARGLNAMLISTKLVPPEHVDKKNAAYAGPEPWKLLAGKKVGTARGSQMEFLLRSYMAVHGMNFERDITFIDLKTNADEVLALQQGAIDVAVIVEPSATQVRLAGNAVLLAYPYDAGAFANLNSGLVVRSDAIGHYGPELQTLVNAHVAAIDYYNQNGSSRVTDTAKTTMFDPAVLTHVMDPAALGLDPKYWKNVNFDYALPEAGLTLFFKDLYQSGFVRKDVSGELAQHLDYSMLMRATQRSKADLGG
jgi:ABC-type nitrate/sulfonate/bicarbonate transport system substrate-binding protein